MPRMLTVVILIAIIVGLFAGNGTVSAAQNITIKWWGYPLSWQGVTGKETLGMAQNDPRRAKYTNGDWYLHVADQFMKENPGVKIEFELLSWSSGREKVDIAILSGATPDIVGQENGDNFLKYAMKGALEPINRYLTREDREDFAPAALAAGYQGGRYWYWPWMMVSEAYMANTTIYKERGVLDLLPKNDLRTWTPAQYVQALQKTTFDRNGDGVPDVFGHGIVAGEEVHDFWRNVYLWGQGANIFDSSGRKSKLMSSKAEAGLQLMADLENKYKVVIPGSVTLNRATMQNHWLNGKVAMTWATPHSMKDIQAAVASGSIKAGSVEPYPISPPSVGSIGPVPRVYVPGFAVFKQKDQAKRDMVMKFARFLTNKTNCAAVAAANQFPVRRSLGNLYPGDEYLAYLNKVKDYPVKEVGSPYITSVRSILLPMFQAVLTRSRTPSEALKEANAKVNAFLAQQLASEKK